MSRVHQFMMSPLVFISFSLVASHLVSTVDKDPPVITHCTRLPHFVANEVVASVVTLFPSLHPCHSMYM